MRRTPAAAALLACVLPLSGCGGLTTDQIEASVSRDLQLRVNRRLAADPARLGDVVVFAEVRCPHPGPLRPGVHLSCRAFGSKINGGAELTYVVDVTITDEDGHVRYTLRRPRAGES